MLKARCLILKKMATYFCRLSGVVVVVMLHNRIRQEALKDCLFEKYSSDDMIVIDSDDKNKKDKMLARLYGHILTVRWTHSETLLPNLVQRVLA